jgi:hypothetical protein
MGQHRTTIMIHHEKDIERLQDGSRKARAKNSQEYTDPGGLRAKLRLYNATHEDAALAGRVAMAKALERSAVLGSARPLVARPAYAGGTGPAILGSPFQQIWMWRHPPR